MKKPELSIIIATFNSEKTLSKVLSSIKKQTFPPKKLEILLVDGGSKDKTISLGIRFGCSVIQNPRTEPIYGKYLGFLSAKGKYIMYLDHDEVLLNKNSIASKISALKNNNNIKAVAGGNYRSPMGYPFINDYINEFGDPFSFFIYRLSKRDVFFLDSMKKKYPIKKQTQKYVIFDLSRVNDLPIIELVAGGSMFDAEFLKKEFPQARKKIELLPHFFYLIYSKHPQIIIMKNDPILHFSADILQKYLTKIIWRIRNNIFFTSTMGESGFSGREKFQPLYFRLQKYLFIPYAFTLIFLFLDTLWLIVTRKNLFYIIHIPLTLYTAILIIYFFILKCLGFRPKLKNYDGSVEVK